MGRPTRIRASNWPMGGSDWPVGGSRTANRRYWRTGGTRATVPSVQYLGAQLGRDAQPQMSGNGLRLKELTKKLATRNSPFTVLRKN